MIKVPTDTTAELLAAASEVALEGLAAEMPMETQNKVARKTAMEEHRQGEQPVVMKIALRRAFKVRPTGMPTPGSAATASEESNPTVLVLGNPKPSFGVMTRSRLARTSTTARSLSTRSAAQERDGTKPTSFDRTVFEPATSATTNSTPSTPASNVSMRTAFSTAATSLEETTPTLSSYPNIDSTDESELSETYSDDFDDTLETMRPGRAGTHATRNELGVAEPANETGSEQLQGVDERRTKALNSKTLATDRDKGPQGARKPASTRKHKQPKTKANTNAGRTNEISKVVDQEKNVKKPEEEQRSVADAETGDGKLAAECEAKSFLPWQINIRTGDVEGPASESEAGYVADVNMIANLRRRYFLGSDSDSGDVRGEEEADGSIRGQRKRKRF